MMDHVTASTNFLQWVTTLLFNGVMALFVWIRTRSRAEVSQAATIAQHGKDIDKLLVDTAKMQDDIHETSETLAHIAGMMEIFFQMRGITVPQRKST